MSDKYVGRVVIEFPVTGTQGNRDMVVLKVLNDIAAVVPGAWYTATTVPATDAVTGVSVKHS